MPASIVDKILDSGEVKALALRVIDLLEKEEADGDMALAAILVVKMALESGGYRVTIENLDEEFKGGSLQ